MTKRYMSTQNAAPAKRLVWATHGSQRHHNPLALPISSTLNTSVRSENRRRGSQRLRGLGREGAADSSIPAA